jgi:hypothetical protein
VTALSRSQFGSTHGRKWRSRLAVPTIAVGLIVASVGALSPSASATDPAVFNQASQLPLLAANYANQEISCNVQNNWDSATQDSWHFVTPSNSTFVHLEVTFSTGSFTLADATQFPDESHAYFSTPAGATLISATGGTTAAQSFFNLSHVCVGPVARESLNVSKTAVTSFARDHKWGITKSVDKAQLDLYAPLGGGPGFGDITWKVGVNYAGAVDSNWAVTGAVSIINDGNTTANVTSVDDTMFGTTPVTLDCGTLPKSLPVGDSLGCTYTQALGAAQDGTNSVVVTTDVKTYSASAAVTFGSPTTETNKTVNVTDLNSEFGSQSFGTVTAPASVVFPYTKRIDWTAPGCRIRTITNTATLAGDGGSVLGSAMASTVIREQCRTFQAETGWAAGGAYSRTNWATFVDARPVVTGTPKTVTLFAGQTMNAGTVTLTQLTSSTVEIKVALTGPWSFATVAENLKVQGYSSAPSGNPSPGLFANKKNCDPASNTCTIVVPEANYYGIHLSVGKWVFSWPV